MKRFFFRHQTAFTLIELMVVVSIISLLSSIVLTSLRTARDRARDAKRVSEIRQIVNALELYRSTNGAYPTLVPDGGADGCPLGWDCSHAPIAPPGPGMPSLATLVSSGYIPVIPGDPANNSTYYYAYRKLNVAIGTCAAGPTRWLLAIKAFESANYTSPDFCGYTTNGTFDWVTGGIE